MSLRPLVVALALVVTLGALTGAASAQSLTDVPNGNRCQQVVPGGSDGPPVTSLFTPSQQASLWLQSMLLRQLAGLLPQTSGEPSGARLERPVRASGSPARRPSRRIG